MEVYLTIQVFSIYIYKTEKVRLPYKNEVAFGGQGKEFKCRFYTGKVNLPYRFMQERRLGVFLFFPLFILF